MVDNIPVYALVHESTSSKVVVLRRLDTDFGESSQRARGMSADKRPVNASSLLAALGVPPSRLGDYLNAPSPTLASHHAVAGSDAGTAHSAGVAGIWVQLVEAREYARKFSLGEGTLLSNILREDLFQQVRDTLRLPRTRLMTDTSFRRLRGSSLIIALRKILACP